MIECPECGADIDVEEDELDEGETILCDECGRTFTVTSLDPLELEPEEDEFDLDEDFEEEDEDFDEEDEEDEEEEEEEDWR